MYVVCYTFFLKTHPTSTLGNSSLFMSCFCSLAPLVFIAVLRAPPPSCTPTHSTLINGDLLSPHRPRSMTFPPFTFKHNIPTCTAARKKKHTTEYTRRIGNTKHCARTPPLHNPPFARPNVSRPNRALKPQCTN